MRGVPSHARWRSLLLAAAFVACAPQLVDAVDAAPPAQAGATNAGHGGSAGRPGSGGGSGGTQPVAGSGTAAGESGAAGAGGADDACELPSGTSTVSCRELTAALVHRFTFEGSGSAVRDALGGPSGRVVGAELAGDGSLTLAGRMTDEYVDLPNGLLSPLTSATLEAWLTWYGGAEWQRIFDFGDDATGVEGSQSSGATYLFLTPRIPDDGGRLLRVAYMQPGYAEVQLDATRTLPSDKLTHVAVTADGPTATLALYIDGALENFKVLRDQPLSLAALRDINDWLGRSQYAADPDLNAKLEEFRIYDTALDAAQLRATFEAGPNPAFLAR